MIFSSFSFTSPHLRKDRTSRSCFFCVLLHSCCNCFQLNSFLPSSSCSSHRPWSKKAEKGLSATDFWLRLVKLPRRPREGCKSSKYWHTTDRDEWRLPVQGYPPRLPASALLAEGKGAAGLLQKDAVQAAGRQPEKGRNPLVTGSKAAASPDFRLNQTGCCASSLNSSRINYIALNVYL